MVQDVSINLPAFLEQAGYHQYQAKFMRWGGKYKTWVSKFFILIDEVLQESFLCGNLLHSININFSKLFNVDRSSVLTPPSMSQSKAGDDNMGRDGYFICSMVVSRVVDCYQWIFSEDKAPADFVDPEIFAPFFAFCEHDIRLLNIVLPCT